jgi:hypothetical protein
LGSAANALAAANAAAPPSRFRRFMATPFGAQSGEKTRLTQSRRGSVFA